MPPIGPRARKRSSTLRSTRSTVIEQYQEGLITDGERYNKVVDIWADAADRIASDLLEGIGRGDIIDPENGQHRQTPSFNPIFMMADSGARSRTNRWRTRASLLLTPEIGGEPREHLFAKGRHLTVKEGDFVRAGEPLMDGPNNPHDILCVKGEKTLAAWLVNEIQQVYRLQAVLVHLFRRPPRPSVSAPVDASRAVASATRFSSTLVLRSEGTPVCGESYSPFARPTSMCTKTSVRRS
jgi:hypothetical protein